MPQGEGTYGSQVGRPTETPKKQRSGFKMNGMGFGQGTGRQAVGGIPPRGAVPMQGRAAPGVRPPFMKNEDKNWKEVQSLEENLKSFRKDLKEAKTPEQKRRIGKDIHSAKNEIAAKKRKSKDYKMYSDLTKYDDDRG